MLALACAKTTSLGSAADDSGIGGSMTPDAANGMPGIDAMSSDDANTRVDTGSLEASCVLPGGDGPDLPVAPCPSGQYCASQDGLCTGSGRCQDIPPPPPPACPSLECGCDGTMRCAQGSTATGINVAPAGFCSMACGPKTCDGLTEFCFHGIGGPPPLDGGGTGGSIYECRPIPVACAVNHTCACLTATEAGTCTETNGRLDLEVLLP